MVSGSARRVYAGHPVKRFLVVLTFFLAAQVFAQTTRSYFAVVPRDPEAVTLRDGEGGLVGDGQADDTAALQKAIDTIEERPRRQGMVFLPSGRYRLTRTLFVWPGIRVIGVGPTRPVLLLAPNTPGYQKGMGYMVFFAGGRYGDGRPRQGDDTPFPGVAPIQGHVVDANPGTFYSAMSNVDLEIGEGNPGAVGIRFHIAQHCYLSHMDFRLGTAMAGLHDVGNEAEDLHFHGGRFGILTRKPSPGWQFTLLDSSFDGQTEAGIEEHEAGLTLVRDTFRDVPHAVTIDRGYADELWIKESRFERISGSAVVVSNENNAKTEINFEDLDVAETPVLVEMRDSGRKVRGPAAMYHVRHFTHGLTMRSFADPGKIETVLDAAAMGRMPAPLPRAIRPLPSAETWTNILDLGAKGDGKTDNTAVFRRAIAEHKTIYVPEGYYLVTDTVALRGDTVLVALHPSRTQIFLADGTPGFNGVGAPRALLSTPPGGSNIVSGIGLSTNGNNNLAIGVLWKAGRDSLMSDTRLLGGHGTQSTDGSAYRIYDARHSGDPDPKRRWDSQYPSIWVTDGGGGVFSDIWTPNTFAQAGMYISHTDGPGRVYELSSEHHVRNEMVLDHAANWEIYALQTEEERGEGGVCLPIEVDNSHDILFANFHSYRVVSMFEPFETAVRVSNSERIHFRNVHIYSDSKAAFDNAVMVSGSERGIRQKEIASLDISEIAGGEAPGVSGDGVPDVFAGPVERLATGFYNISGAAVDPKGQIYFADFERQRIYRWNAEKKVTEVVRNNPISAVNLFFDKAGDLMATSYEGNGTVLSMRPGDPMGAITVLKPQAARPMPGKTAVLPTDFWRLVDDDGRRSPAKAWQFVSMDGTTFLPVGDDFLKGTLYYGTKMHDVLRAFGFVEAPVGGRAFFSDEDEHKTWSATVGADGSLGDLKLFAERGGEGVVWDRHGKVYVADGQIYVYRADGTELGVLAVPEHPTDLLFGGADGKTMFILARTSLYAVRMR